LEAIVVSHGAELLDLGDDEPGRVDAVNSISPRAQAVREVGLLDEGYWLLEDLDWCHRLRDTGWKGLL